MLRKSGFFDAFWPFWRTFAPTRAAFCSLCPPLMLTKTKAIVLRTVKYGDRRLIIDTFTRDSGTVSFAATVPKTARGRLKRQYFQPLTLLDLECDIRPSATLHRIRDVRLAWPYTTLPFDPGKLSVALFLAEFLVGALRGEQRNEALFDYICDSLMWLDSCEAHFANFHIVFMARLTRFLGFYPNLDGYRPGCCFDLRAACFSPLTPLHRDVLHGRDAEAVGTVMRMDFATMRLFRMSRAERNRLADIILSYYRLHLPSFPELRSLDVLRAL